MRRAVEIGAVAVFAMVATRAVAAPCTQSREALALAQSLRRSVRCIDRALRSGASTECGSELAPPACAATLAAETLALAYGPNDPPRVAVPRDVLRVQLVCQREIGRAAAGFVAEELRLVLTGRSDDRAEARARRRFDHLPGACRVRVAEDAKGVALPAVGETCRGTVGSRGSAVDGDALRACLLSALEAAVDRAGSSPSGRPNLVIILTDDQRWDTTDATHAPDHRTPVMPTVETRLAASGVRFTNAFVTTSLCCPSRASILKGQYAHTTGVRTNRPPLGGAARFDDTATLATWLQSQGYRTGLVGKYLNHYGELWTPPATPYVPPGWTEWHAFRAPDYYDFELVEHGGGPDHALVSYPSGCAHYTECPGDLAGCESPANYSTDVLTVRALDFLDRSAGQPFFLYFAPYAPHAPACSPPEDEGRFAALAPWRPPNWNEADVSDKPAWVQSLCPMSATKQADIDSFRQKQLASLQAVDRAVGAILDTLIAMGQEDNTLVLFTSDNGYGWGAHCHKAKRCPYEECMRVPLIVHHALLAPGPRTEPRVGLNIDFASTSAEIAGLTPPVPQDGRSLVRVLADREPRWRSDFLYEQWLDPADEDDDAVPPSLSEVRTTRWKYIEYATGERELYDLDGDPFELQNRAGDATLGAVEADLAVRLEQLRSSASPAFLDGRTD